MKWVGIILPTIIAIASFIWMPLSVWIQMNQGLLVFLGLLAAALVQIIPVTANFLQSDRLTPIEAERLSAQLGKQQLYWIGLLASTVAAVVLVVIISALDKKPTEIEIPKLGRLDIGTIDIAPGLSALVAFAISFVLVKMFGLFQGVISLQKLRSELVINAAKRAAAEQVKQASSEVSLPQQLVPDDYGKIIRPH
ncbi:hypothetical protein [Noviherbaspirillum sp. UKPF54]|uniref:hypothetical protein n=1 Tax=Noviherbaspirillum sp. UKPF54 TaxID=2601898 RepID=UPI0011B14E7B|nr:hypothetical protein [Noviherbaspirillum sp. UKPF54]QDZ27005.1 hypothetical protein FAY22_02920 [Noviherbaspirillum sp. UKPF54]